MKKVLSILFLLAALMLLAWAVSAVNGQQVTPVTVTNTAFPAVTWTGSNAQALAIQLLAITNANGSLVAPTNVFASRGNVLLLIRIQNGTNGVKSITVNVH